MELTYKREKVTETVTEAKKVAVTVARILVAVTEARILVAVTEAQKVAATEVQKVTVTEGQKVAVTEIVVMRLAKPMRRRKKTGTREKKRSLVFAFLSFVLFNLYVFMVFVFVNLLYI